MPKRRLSDIIAELNARHENDAFIIRELTKQKDEYIKVDQMHRAELEELRKDKRWFQSIISPLAQAIHTRS